MSSFSLRMLAEPSKLRRALFQAIMVAGAGIAAGVINNAVSPRGIPLLGEWSKKYGFPSPGGVHSPAYRNVEIDAREALRLREEGALFLDARPPEGFAGGHIPGARSFPEDGHRDRLDELIGVVEGYDRVVVYCQSIDCDEAHLLARSLRDLEVQGVYVFSGGLKEWRETELPVENEAGTHHE